GKPSDNAYIEAFNSRLRQECLNASWFLSMGDARVRIEAWRIDYNRNRPHSALGGLTPSEFVDSAEARRFRRRVVQGSGTAHRRVCQTRWWCDGGHPEKTV
ncbi:MAG: transposase, partial [Pseudomonadota bacterium]